MEHITQNFVFTLNDTIGCLFVELNYSKSKSLMQRYKSIDTRDGFAIARKMRKEKILKHSIKRGVSSSLGIAISLGQCNSAGSLIVKHSHQLPPKKRKISVDFQTINNDNEVELQCRKSKSETGGSGHVDYVNAAIISSSPNKSVIESSAGSKRSIDRDSDVLIPSISSDSSDY